MKKFCKSFFFILIVIYAWSYKVYSQNAGITSITSATSCPGTIITLSISVLNSPAVSGFSLAIYYDAAVLSALQIGDSSIFISFVNATTAASLPLPPFAYWASSQTTKSPGVKQAKMAWSSGNGNAYQLDTITGNIAHLVDIQFRYLGGTTSVIFNNSPMSGGSPYGGLCEYDDYQGNGLNDFPTSTYYINGAVTSFATPSNPGLITGPLSPCQGTQATYSVVNSNGITYTWTAPGGWTGSSTSNSIIYSLVIGSAANGNISVTPSNYCGSGPPSSIYVSPGTLSSAASSATVTPATICVGASTTLSVVGGSLGSGGLWRWFTGSCGGTVVGTGLTKTQTPASTTVYYVRAEGTCNTTTCVNTTVTVNTLSTAATFASATPVAVCNGFSSTLSFSGGSLGSFGVWSWYSSSCGGTFTGNGSTLVVSPSITTIYYVRAEGSCNTTVCVSTTLQINSLSSPATLITPASPSACAGSSTTISSTGGSLGTGANWHWYSNSCGGTPAGTNLTVSVSPTATTVFYVRAEGLCNTTTCISKTITISSLATSPDSIFTTPSSISAVCSGSSITLDQSGANLFGATLRWYTGSCGGIYFNSGSAVTVNPIIATSYYVRAEGACNTTSCASITILIKANSTIASSIIAMPSAICPGSPTTLNVNGGSLGAGANWFWYTASCGGVLMGSGISIVQNPTAQTTYYVRAAGDCNTTACINISLVLNSNSSSASSASSTPSTICSGLPITLNVIGGSLGSGANWNWYKGSCGSSYLFSGNPSVLYPTTTTTYYVRAEGTCNSTICVSITVPVTLGPSLPTGVFAFPSTGINLGQSSTISVTGSLNPGDFFKWYSGSCGSAVSIGTGSQLVVNPLASAIYWVRSENGACFSGCLSVTVIVNSLLNDPSSIIANPGNICTGSSSTLNLNGTLNGGQWFWYLNSCGGTFIINGVTSITVNPVSTTTYYVRQEFQTFHSNCLSSIVTVSTASTPPTGFNTGGTTICQGNQISLIETGGVLGSSSVWKWYSGTCGGSIEGTGVSITKAPTSTTTYFIRAEGFCNTTACLSVIIAVNSISVVPSSIIATPANICNGSNSTLTLAGGTLGVNSVWNWYTGNCGSNLIATGASIVVSPVSATKYFVRAVGPCNTTNCVNLTLTIGTLSVSANTISLSPSTICSGSPSIISVVGGSTGSNSNWYWYSGSCGGTFIGTGFTLTQYPLSTLTYYVRAEGSCNTTSCVTNTLTVLTSPLGPVSCSANPGVISTGQSSTLTVNGVLNPGSVWVWYENGCGAGVPVGTGTTIIVFPPATDTYYVRGENGVCFSPCVSTIVSIPGSLNSPTAVFANPNPICSGQTTTLGLNGTLNGGQWHWYTNGCGGIPVGTGSIFAVTPLVSTIYSVRQEDGSGHVSGCGSVQVNFDTLSVLPLFISATPDTFCAGNSTNLLISGQITGTGAVWKWYTGSCGGTLTGTGINIVSSPANPVTYYIRAESSCNTTPCMTVSVIVITASSPPLTATGVRSVICIGDTTILTKVGGSLGTGANWNWYSGSCGGAWVGTGVSTSQIPFVSTTFYVRAESSCSTTNCVTKNITVYIKSSAPIGALSTDSIICAGSPDTLYVVGGSLGTNGQWAWYSGYCGSTHTGTGATIVVNPLLPTNYYVRAEGTCNTTGCFSVSILVQQQSVSPVSINANPSSVCSGLSSVLNLYGGFLGTNAKWIWYSNSCGSIIVGTGSSTIQTPSVTTVYYVRAEGICNSTICLSITINVDSVSIIPFVATTTTPTICFGYSSSINIIGGSLGSNATWRWYSGSCGGIYEGSGTGITVSPSQTTIYFVRGEGSCNTTNCLSLTIDINPNSSLPSGANAIPQSICNGLSTMLNITGGTLGTGGVWAWYSGSCGIGFAGNGNSITQNPTTTSTYFVRSEGLCNTSACITTIVIVNDSSVTATSVIASPAILCGGNSASMNFSGGSLGTNAGWYWYTGSCGGTFIGNGLSINQTPTISTLYFVRAEGLCNTTNCVSIFIIVNSASVIGTNATAIPPVICNGGSALLQTTGGILGTGAGWFWYSSSCGINFVANGASISQSPTSSTIYYVRAENSCNTTNCLSVTITVSSNSIAASTATASPAIICSGLSSTLSFSGGNLGVGALWVWYSGYCGGTFLDTGLTIIETPTITTLYYLRAESYCNTTSCVSTYISVNSNSIPVNFAYALPFSLCTGTSSTLSINGGSLGSGSLWEWYSGVCNGALIGTGVSLTQSPLTTTVYYVNGVGTCNTTICASVTVTVNSFSNTPASASALPNSVCTGSATNLSVSGGSLGTGAVWAWYLNSCGGIVSGIGNTITQTPTSSGIYYVRAEGTCNTTGCVSVNVSVNSNSVQASSISIIPSTVCSGTQLQLIINGGYLGTGAIWNWYSGNCGGLSIGSGVNLFQTPLNSTTYYVRAEGLCNTSMCISFAVTVNTLSSVVSNITAVPSTICSGSTSVLTQNGGLLGTNSAYYWYTGYCGGTLIGNGNSVSVTPSISTLYYVRAEGLCNTTACTTLGLLVNSVSTRATSAIATAINICSGDSTVLSKTGGFLGTGANWYWYTGSCGGILVGSGSSKTTFPAISGVYFVRAEGICNTTLCTSISIIVNLSSSLATNISASSSVICTGASSTITIIGGSLGTAGVWKWYSAFCGSNLTGTGVSLVVSPTSTTTYYIRAEGTCNTTNCLSKLITVNTFSINALSISSSQSAICTGGSSILTINSGTLGSGASWYWYSSSCGVTSVGTNLSIVVSPTVTTTFWVRAEGSCNSTSCVSVTVTLNDVSIQAISITSVPAIVCAGQSLTLIKNGGVLGTGADWYWYTGNCGGTFIGNNAMINVTPVISTIYYVRAQGICNITNCTSISITLATLPAQPSAIAGNINPANGSNEVYSVINDINVSSYNWTSPVSWSGISSTNIINYIIGPGSGTITVTPKNSCGYGPSRTLNIDVGYNISGQFTYDNTISTPLDSVKIYLKLSGNVVDSVQADINGNYMFSNVINGSYNISARTHKPWTGVNSTDAAKVIRHFNGLELLTSSIKLHSADVNFSMNINANDASKITRRFLGYDTSFARGNWIFEKPIGGDTLTVSPAYNDTIIVNNSDVIQDFKGLCVGDVNSSNFPGQGAKSSYSISLTEQGSLKVYKNEPFEIAVKVNKQMDLSAISLIFTYPANSVEIVGISSDNYDVLFNDKKGELRIAWSDLLSKSIDKDNAIIKLKVILHGNLNNHHLISLGKTDLNELADDIGLKIDNVVLIVPKIETAENLIVEKYNESNANQADVYPNPASDKITVVCKINESGNLKIKLYNVLGSLVKDFTNENIKSGTINKEFSIGNISTGIYMCKIEFTGANNKFEKLLKVVITH